MSKRSVALCALLLPLFVLVSCSKMKNLPPEMATDAPVTMSPWGSAPEAGKSAASFMEASAAKKHLFIYFYAPGQDNAKLRKVFNDSLQKITAVAQPAVINVKDPSEKAVVQRFRLDQKGVPMPLVIVLAPNGTIVNGFPKDRIAEQGLMSAIASPNFQRCLKALQDNKLLIVCAVVPDPKKGPQVPSGVLDFCKDPKYTEKTRVVVVDPTNVAEGPWLNQLRIDPNSKDVTTVLLAPPGNIVTSVVGAVKKKVLVDAVEKPATPPGMGGPGGPSSAPPPSNPPPSNNPAPAQK